MKKMKNAARTGGKHPENPFQKTRVKAGLTQEQVAEYLNCSVKTVQRHEAGERTLCMIHALKLAKAYNCDMQEFFPELNLSTENEG